MSSLCLTLIAPPDQKDPTGKTQGTKLELHSMLLCIQTLLQAEGNNYSSLVTKSTRRVANDMTIIYIHLIPIIVPNEPNFSMCYLSVDN